MVREWCNCNCGDVEFAAPPRAHSRCRKVEEADRGMEGRDRSNRDGTVLAVS